MSAKTQSGPFRFPPGPRSVIPGKVVGEFRRSPLEFFIKLRRQYGDVAGFHAFGQKYIVISHPDLAREILLTDADAYHKGPALKNSRGILGEGLLTAEGEDHKQQRRMMQPSFHAKHVENYARDIIDSTREMLARWSATFSDGTASTPAVPAEIEIRGEMMGLTLVIAGRALFGTLLADEINLVRRCMDDLMLNFRRAVVPWGKLLNYLPLASTRRLETARREMRRLVDRMIAARRAAPGEGDGRPPRRDLLSMMIAATDDDSGHRGIKLTDQQLRDQAITILMAGHETTANAMTFTLYLLAKHPEEQRQLREEVLRVLGTGEPTAAIADQLPRARWVLSEAMRLYPPAWTLGRQNQRPVTLGGYHLPAKSTLLIPQWAIHRDERFWESPDDFRPDRWHNPTRPRFAYLPFSTGPRNCIGESFAWLEMILALAMIVRDFEFTLPPGTPEPATLATITLRPRDAITLHLASTAPEKATARA